MTAFEFEITGLSKKYYGRPALRDLSLSIEKGSLCFLLGANGSGKSTLLKCMAGHQLWDGGEVLRFGKNRKDDRVSFNRGLHVISEDVFPPLASLNVLKRLYADLFGNWDEALFQKLIAYGGLDESKDLQSCSRGQKIQGILALTLSCVPETLLVDEATAVLDPYIRSRFVHEIVELVRRLGTTVVIATNIATELAMYDGRLIVMDKGAIALDMPSKRIGEEFIKIRVEASSKDVFASKNFSFIETNTDGSVTFVGHRGAISELRSRFEEDRRVLTIDEVFIHFSERKTS